MGRRFALSMLALWTLAASPVAAEDDLVDLELTVPISIVDRSATGTGEDLFGYGYDERVDASEDLDHAGLGWRLGLDLSVHLDNFVVGVGLGVRQYFGIDAPVSRGWLMDVGLRVGGRIDFGDHPAE